MRPVGCRTDALSSGEVRRSLTLCGYSGISGRCFLAAVCLPTAVRCSMVMSRVFWRCLILCKDPIGWTRQCAATRVDMASHNAAGYSHPSAVATRHPCSHFTPHCKCLCLGDSPQHHTSNADRADILTTMAVPVSGCDPFTQALKHRNSTGDLPIGWITSGICHMIDV